MVSVGYNLLTPVFENTTKNPDGTCDASLQSLQLIGAADQTSKLWLVNSSGNFEAVYYWWNAYGSDPAGWYADESGDPDTYDRTMQLKPGQCVYVDIVAAEDGVEVVLQTSGAVKVETTSRVLVDGYYMIGNNTPSKIMLQDIKLINSADQTSKLWLVNSSGNFEAVYYWWNAYGSDPAGWYADEGGDPDTYDSKTEINPGKGVYVSLTKSDNTDENVTVKIKSVFE